MQEQNPAYELPGLRMSGREPGLQPEKVDWGQAMRPVHERPAPKATPHHFRGNESAGRQKGIESPVQHSGPASPPGKENVHPEGKSSVAPSEQTPQRPEHGMAVRPDKKAGNGASRPATPEKSPFEESPTHAFEGVSDGRSPGVGTKVPADHKAPTRTLAGHKAGPETTPAANPTYRRAGTEGGIYGPRSAGIRREEPASVAEPSPSDVPDPQIARSFQRAVPLHVRDAIAAAPPGGTPREQAASGTPLGATKFLLDPLWDERSSLVDLTEEALRRASGSPTALSTGTLHRGTLTQRGPPLEIPQPFSGFVPMMGGAAVGSVSSGIGGAAPLLAVMVACLIAHLYQGWFRTFCAFLRPGTVPWPALERPG